MMGKIVLVDRVYRRDWENIKDGTRKTWHVADAEGRPGWVVGERWLHDGVADYDPEHGFAWTSRGVSHHCLLVVYWPTMNPVQVPPDGYRLAPETVKPYRPVQSQWSDSDRERLSADMRNWPRDEKGRWVKYGPDRLEPRQGS